MLSNFPVLGICLLFSMILPLLSKECVFLHGAGESSFSPATSSFTGYWGDVHMVTSQCSAHIFIHANTNDFGWDSPILMEYYCNISLSGSRALNGSNEKSIQFITNSDGVPLIVDKIVFSHSVGKRLFVDNRFWEQGSFPLRSTLFYHLKEYLPFYPHFVGNVFSQERTMRSNNAYLRY